MTQTLIIGGSRFLGPEVVRLLLNRGDEVTVFNRGNEYNHALPDAVHYIRGDRTKPEDIHQIKNKDFDLVYDMCCYDKDDAAKLLDVVNPRSHLVFLSTAAVYKKPDIYPINEDSDLGEWNSFGGYGTNKAAAEASFGQFAQEHSSKLTIFRPTYLLGEDNYFDRENYYFSRLKKNQSILVPGNGNALIQLAFLEETAQAFVDVPFKQEQQIEILNIGGDQYVSVVGIVELCAKIAKCDANIINLDTVKCNLDEQAFYDDLYPFPNLNFVTANERIKTQYGIKFKSLELGLSELYQKWLSDWNGEVNIYPKEAAILEKAKK